jgi:hypothetical protein
MIIASEDSVYSYTILRNTGRYGSVAVHKLSNNKKISSTQGYQIKTQTGRNRIESVIDILDTESNILTNLYPMLEYPVEVNVTFDERPPLRSGTELKMVITSYEIDDQIQDMDDGDLRMKIKLVEIIGV